jgi:hypothetical protein
MTFIFKINGIDFKIFTFNPTESLYPSFMNKNRRFAYVDRPQIIFGREIYANFCFSYDYTLGSEEIGIAEFNLLNE